MELKKMISLWSALTVNLPIVGPAELIYAKMVEYYKTGIVIDR